MLEFTLEQAAPILFLFWRAVVKFLGEAQLKGNQKTGSSFVTLVWYGCESA